MNFGDFLMMQQEIGLMAVFVILLLIDIFSTPKIRSWYHLIACGLFTAYTAFSFFPVPLGNAFGGMYESSAITAFMKGILSIGTLFVFLQAHKWLKSAENANKAGEFYLLTIATLLGMFFMISSRNFMMLYIGIETASLPLACLVAYNKHQKKSAEAGAKYIMISAFASGIIMFGMSFLYGAMGSLYFDEMNGILTTPLSIIGLVFFFSGLAFKLSLVPFHLWTADVYQGAPTSITAYLSVVSKGAAAFALIFAIYKIFGNMQQVWHEMLWWLSIITITVGNLFALRQKDIKRFFAFSSISQAGYILLGIIAGTAQGMTATVYFVLIYLFSNLAIFAVLTALESNSNNLSMASLNGLYKTNPKLSFVMMLAVFSLAGIPPFAGFFSKFFIFAAAAERGEYLLVFIALVNTVISLYYYLLIIKAMFIEKQGEYSVTGVYTDGYNKVAIVACTAGILILGFISIIYEYIGTISIGL